MEERVCIDCRKKFIFKNNKIPERCPNCRSYLSLFKKEDISPLTLYSGTKLEELPRQDFPIPAT